MYTLQEYLDSSLFLTASYGNNVGAIEKETDAEDINDMMHYFWIRVLLFYFMYDFAERFAEKRLTPENVIAALASYAKVRYIHISIDEYNLLITQIIESSRYYEAPKTERTAIVNTALKAIFQATQRAMGAAKVNLSGQEETVLVTSLYTGTLRDEFNGTFADSFGKVVRIPANLFTPDDVLALMTELIDTKYYLKNNDAVTQKGKEAYCEMMNKRLTSAPVIAAASIVGIVPRCAEILFLDYLADHSNNCDDVSYICSGVEQAIIDRYSLATIGAIEPKT
jgi:hypothetical protein